MNQNRLNLALVPTLCVGTRRDLVLSFFALLCLSTAVGCSRSQQAQAQGEVNASSAAQTTSAESAQTTSAKKAQPNPHPSTPLPPSRSASDGAGTGVKVAAESAPKELVTVQPARVEAFETTPLFAKVTGYVDRVRVDIGDRVKQDDVLMELKIPEMLDELKQKEALLAQAQAEIIQADAAIQAAKAARTTAQTHVAEARAGLVRAKGEFERWTAELKRITALAEDGSISRKLVDETRQQYRSADAAQQEAQARIDSAEADVQEASAQLQKTEADKIAAEARLKVARADRDYTSTMLGYTKIMAPFDGVITRRNVHTGHFVEPGNGSDASSLLVIARTDPVRIFVEVPETQAPLVDVGDQATIRVPALKDREFPGSVTRTSWALNPQNRSLTVEIDVRNPEGVLRPGMYATARIVLERGER